MLCKNPKKNIKNIEISIDEKPRKTYNHIMFKGGSLLLSQMQTKTKCDMVVDTLLAAIIDKKYPTGSQLPTEGELCTMLGVSRITVRESLKKLDMMGVVSIQQGKGTFVKEVGLNTFMQPMFGLIDFDKFDIASIYDARLYIETGSCRLAAKNRTDADIANLESLLIQMKDAVDQQRLETALAREFHIAIASASKNNILEATVTNLEDISSACVQRLNKVFTFMGEAHSQHEKIFEAIKAQDEDAAERAIIAHTQASKEFLL